MPISCPAKKYILFDLDGTLLPMDLQYYVQLYFNGLSQKLPHIAPDKVHAMLWDGIRAMMYNQSGKTNREAFAEAFTAHTGIDYYANEKLFIDYYLTEYNDCAASCRAIPLAREIVRILREKGYVLTLATSPLYPTEATHTRIGWAGLDEKDFAFVTTFESFHSAKPSLSFDEEVCRKLGVLPQDCLMVGNDVQEDGAARETGMPVLLVTDCLINRSGESLEGFITGTLAELYQWAQALPEAEA